MDKNIFDCLFINISLCQPPFLSKSELFFTLASPSSFRLLMGMAPLSHLWIMGNWLVTDSTVRFLADIWMCLFCLALDTQFISGKAVLLIIYICQLQESNITKQSLNSLYHSTSIANDLRLSYCYISPNRVSWWKQFSLIWFYVRKCLIEFCYGFGSNLRFYKKSGQT